MHWRSEGPPFLIILAVCMAGVLHTSWWAVLAGAAALVLYSLLTHPNTTQLPLAVLAASSFSVSSLTAVGAFLFGWAARWAWGL